MPDYQGRREAEVAAPPEACFAALTDYDSMPEWQRALKSVRVLEPGDGSDLVEFEVDARVRTFRYRLRCLYDEPQAIDSIYVDGPFRDFSARWRFEPIGSSPDRTNAVVEVRLDPGRLVPRPVARIVEDALLGRAVEDLKRRVEGGGAG
jgi:ribosome-associated toxin RatA of RatAB toxin-antitoxin module